MRDTFDPPEPIGCLGFLLTALSLAVAVWTLIRESATRARLLRTSSRPELQEDCRRRYDPATDTLVRESTVRLVDPGSCDLPAGMTITREQWDAQQEAASA